MSINKNYKNYNKLKPFQLFCLNNFPFIDATFDANTYYELLCKVVEYLNKIQENNEITIEIVEDLKSFVEHYFDNLNVQEEINNKLDAMAEDGTLGRVLANYINIANIKLLGCVGDGETDNKEKLQEIFNTYNNIYIDDGIYYSSEPINVKSNTNIDGTGTLKCDLNATGEINKTITTTSILVNKVNTEEELPVNSMLNIYYEDESDNTLNKRQIVVTSTDNGKLSNNLLNYNNNYKVVLIDSIKNVKIKNITIDGNILLNYCQDFIIDNIVNKNGFYSISKCYNIKTTNSIFQLNNDDRIDCKRGSSNINFDTLNIYGGNTPSDNSAIKFNECFYCNVNNINFGTPKNTEVTGYTGYFHAFMTDGDFTEDNYPNNYSQYITGSKLVASDGYYNTCFITKSKHIKLYDIVGSSIQIKNSDDVIVDKANIASVNNEINNTNLKVLNSSIDHVNIGSRSNILYDNCIIDTFTIHNQTHDVTLNNCIIDKFSNANAVAESSYNIFIKGCTISSICQLAGIRNAVIDIVAKCRVSMSHLYHSITNILIIGALDSDSFNISLNNSQYNKIYYDVVESAKKTQVAYIDLTNTQRINNDISCRAVLSSTNPNANPTKAILKSGAIPSEGYHFVGEIIFNALPTQGGYVGWVCVTSGTPGTWRGFGSIQQQ